MSPSSLCLLFLLPAFSLSEVTSFTKCSQFFSKGIPPTVLQDPTDNNRFAEICQCILDQNKKPQYFYATLYDTKYKIPVYSAYEFRAVVERVDRWYVEPQLDGANLMCMTFQRDIPLPNRGLRQALNNDYENSGFDKGHLFPVYHANDDTMLATSTLTNAAPQNITFNRGQWKKHEEALASVVQKDCNRAYIVTGVVAGNQMIGNNVRVARYYWSAYCCFVNHITLRSEGFIGPDNNGLVQKGSVIWLESELSKHYGANFTIFQGSC